MTKTSKFSKALTRVTDKLKKDLEYRETWKANLAMAYKDCEDRYIKRTGKKHLNTEDKHIIANESADYFLTLLCK